MSTKIEDDERISSYLRGEMSKEEENAFKNDLQINDDLRSRTVAMAYLAKAMHEVGKAQDNDIKEALMSISEDDARNIAAKAIRQSKVRPILRRMVRVMSVRRPLRRRVVRVLSVAASVIVLCIVGFQYYDYKSTTNLGEEYGSMFVDAKSYSRGAADEAGKQSAQELANLYDNVQRRINLDATIKRLSLLWEISTMENVYSYYTIESPQIGWNLAIACLKDNDKKTAKDVLIKLISTTKKDAAINKSARELLKKI